MLRYASPSMKNGLMLLLFLALGSGVAASSKYQPQVREYHFDVRYKDVYPDCVKKTVPAINNQFPAPEIAITEGDTLVVHVHNNVNESISFHWHGFVQDYRKGGNPWADGPAYITQCPIPPGGSFTYRMVVEGQRGTFFYHGHRTYLIGDIIGPLIVHPRPSAKLPYKKPAGEHYALLSAWHHEQMASIYEREQRRVIPSFEAPGGQSLLINGRGKFDCPANRSVVPCLELNCDPVPCRPHARSCRHPIFNVKPGKTYLFRIANTAWGAFLRFGIAGHKMTIVEADASYTKPLTVDYVNIGPGQTYAVLVKIREEAGNYWIASTLRVNRPSVGPALAILRIKGAPKGVPEGPPPSFPPFDDENATIIQSQAIRSYEKFPLAGKPVTKHARLVPNFGKTPGDLFIAGAMNNVSLPEPTTPLLAAEYFKIPGVFTEDFPDDYPIPVDVLNPPAGQLTNVEIKDRSTRLLKLPYKGVVELVIQNGVTVIPQAGNFKFYSEHPFHTHGYTFYVVGTGLGLWDPEKDPQNYNLVDPVQRYTVSVPSKGWAAIRFRADNPGVWLFHCHLQTHMSAGMQLAFLVRRPDGYLPPPPKDTPRCGLFQN